MCVEKKGEDMKPAQDERGGKRCENTEAKGQSGVWETESPLALLCSFYFYFKWLYNSPQLG